MPKTAFPAPLVAVRIVERDGVPVRDAIRFSTGTLLPGETLEVPQAQAHRALMTHTVEEAKTSPPPPTVTEPRAVATPKRKRSPRPVAAASSEDFV